MITKKEMSAEVKPTELKSIYEMGYGEKQEIEELLREHASLGNRFIHLPDHQAVVTGAKLLGVEDCGNLLLVYQLLKANDQSDVVCNIDDSTGTPCGGLMKKYVNKLKAEYRCRNNPKHVVDTAI